MQTQSLSTQELKEILQKVITKSPIKPQPPKEVIPQQLPLMGQRVQVSQPESRVLPPPPSIREEVREPNRETLGLQDALEKAKLQVIDLALRCKEYQAQNDSKDTEITRYKEAVATLSQSLQAARIDAMKIQDDFALRVQGSMLDNHEAKTRLLRLISDKKELEDKVTALSCEKATLSARLQNLTQKGTSSQEAEVALSAKVKELTDSLESTTAELTRAQDLCIKNESLLTRLEEIECKLNQELLLKQQLSDNFEKLSSQLENEKTSHAQELAVCQACLHERGLTLEEEQQKFRLLSQEHLFLQKRVEEQESHLRLLEQHLARRVKECALLSKQVEELMDRSTLLQNSLSTSMQKCVGLEETLESAKKVESALRIELESRNLAYQEAIQHKEEEIAEYHDALKRRDEDLTALRRVQNQFFELEQHIMRSAEIFAKDKGQTSTGLGCG